MKASAATWMPDRKAIKTTVRPITKQRLQATRQAIRNWRSTVAEPLMAMAAQPQSRAEAQRQGGIDRV